MVDQYLAAVRESGQSLNVVAPQPSEDLPLPDVGVQQPLEEDLPLLDDLVRDANADEIDMLIPVFNDLEPLTDYSPPPIRSWSRSEAGGLRQRPPKPRIFDL